MQSIIFNKKLYTLSEATTWCINHGYKTDVHITPTQYRFRQ